MCQALWYRGGKQAVVSVAVVSSLAVLTPDSLLWLPHLDRWWCGASQFLKAALLMCLRNLPVDACKPLTHLHTHTHAPAACIVLATSSVPWTAYQAMSLDLPPALFQLFSKSVIHIKPPAPVGAVSAWRGLVRSPLTQPARVGFFEYLIAQGCMAQEGKERGLPPAAADRSSALGVTGTTRAPAGSHL